MTNNTDLQQARQELAEAQEKIKAVQARIDRLENGTGGFWVPDVDYFFIGDNRIIGRSAWGGDKIDIYRLRHNNIFKTYADAQRKLDIETRLFEISGEVDYFENLYTIEYMKENATLHSYCNSLIIPFGNIVSNDPEFYNKALSQIGETDLKWFYSYGWRRV